MNRSVLTVLFVAVAFTAAGCGASGNAKPQAQQHQASTKTTDSAGAAQLDAAVRLALRQNSQLSLYTLWHNRIPAWAQQSTRGPALAELRSSAAQRRRQGIQIKHLSGRLEILSVRLDPSYLSATAVVRAHDRVRPYRSGRPLGKSIQSNERARVVLRRVGREPAFVVWRLVLLR